MRKITIVTRNLQAGGAERVIAQLANYMCQKGYECTIILLYEDSIFYALDPRVHVMQIEIDNQLTDKIKRYSLLRKKIKKDKPEVVLALPEDIGIYTIIALAGMGLPIFVSERNNPWIMPKKKITRILRTISYRYASGVIFQTHMAQSYFNKKIQCKSRVIGNPVDESRLPLQFRGTRDKTVVGIGRLEKQKNFELLIRAFAEFQKIEKEYTLIIYGEGSLKEELSQIAEELKIKHKVQFPGKKENVLELIYSAGMFVLSSDYEGLPNALIEAMCIGMPVIATDCPSGGPSELIINNENGILVECGNDKMLKEAMLKMSDTSYSSKMADAAYRKRKELTSENIYQEWVKYLFENDIPF